MILWSLFTRHRSATWRRLNSNIFCVVQAPTTDISILKNPGYFKNGRCVIILIKIIIFVDSAGRPTMSTNTTYTVSNIIKQENSKSEINSYLKILAPIQFTLEFCSGTSQTDFLNILLASPIENNFYHFQNGAGIMKFNGRAPHLHDFYELLIVLDGEIHQQIEQTDYTIHSGSCCLMNRNIVHKEVFHSNANLLCIGISKELVKSLAEDGQKVYFPACEQPFANPILTFLVNNLDNPDTKEYLDFLPTINNADWYRVLHTLTDNILRTIMFPKLGSTYVIKGMLLELFGYLSDPAQYHFTSVHVEADNDFLLFSHISHLLEDTDGRITRSQLEEILHYSGNYLNSIVKKYTNLCLFDYGQTFCMKKAASLLCKTDDSVLEIMEKLQFTNTTHFYKCFKKQYHMTPREYRIANSLTDL